MRTNSSENSLKIVLKVILNEILQKKIQRGALENLIKISKKFQNFPMAHGAADSANL